MFRRIPREIEQRKLNIIVFNVPDTEKESVDVRKNDDLEFLRGMMSDVELNVPFSQVSMIVPAAGVVAHHGSVFNEELNIPRATNTI